MKLEITDAPFRLELDAGGMPQVNREITFSNGDSISFTVTLDRDDTATIPDLHKKSAREVINRLEAWIAIK